MKKLLIVESPGKVEKLTSILGPGWRVAASKGHIRDLPENEIGVEAPEFRPKYVFIPGAPIPGNKGKHYRSSKDRVDRLIALARDAEAVYLATDPDREGESISWHLQQAMKLKNPHRVTFNEVTDAAVKAAVAAPRLIDVQLVAAQEARRVIDRLVGYLVSPVASDLASQKLSAGRVQTPAVWLVMAREREITAFKPTSHFGAMLNFAGAKVDWKAEWETKPDFASDEQPYFMDRGFAERVAVTRLVTVAAFKAGEQKRAPPPPFTTSTLQQAASVKLGMSPAQTMEAAQRLFDQGHITYHRTDNPNVSDESLPDIFAVATKLGLDMADEPRKFKASEASQAGHPACTPTHWEVEEAGESGQDAALYKLIRLRSIACQLAAARYAIHTATLIAPGPHEGTELSFSGSGRALVYSGWLKLLAKDDTEEEAEPEALNSVPLLTVGEQLNVKSGEVLSKRTKAPKRYTEASLVKKLEAEGVGRPSTYASIMETIVAKRQYLEVVEKFLRPTSKGIALINALENKFQFVLPSFTREMEKQLDAVAQGRQVYRPVVEQMYGALQAELLRVQDAMPKFACTSCGKSLRRIVMPGKSFWGCTGHPACSVTLPDEDGKPGERTGAMATEFACGKCGKPLIHRRKKGAGGYDFFSCSGYSEGCKQAYENQDGKPNLPSQ